MLGNILVFLVIKGINVIPVSIPEVFVIPKYRLQIFLSIIVVFEIMAELEMVKKKEMTSYIWICFMLEKVAVKIVKRLYVDFAEIQLSLEAIILQFCLVTYKSFP